MNDPSNSDARKKCPEKKRRSAQRFGLKTVGVVGVLIEAKAHGLIAEVGPLLERLRQEAGFYLSDRVIREARAFFGE